MSNADTVCMQCLFTCSLIIRFDRDCVHLRQGASRSFVMCGFSGFYSVQKKCLLCWKSTHPVTGTSQCSSSMSCVSRQSAMVCEMR